jgi:hypothetical protein
MCRGDIVIVLLLVAVSASKNLLKYQDFLGL